jgi:hypothetical protein
MARFQGFVPLASPLPPDRVATFERPMLPWVSPRRQQFTSSSWRPRRNGARAHVTAVGPSRSRSFSRSALLPLTCAEAWVAGSRLTASCSRSAFRHLFLGDPLKASTASNRPKRTMGEETWVSQHFPPPSREWGVACLRFGLEEPPRGFSRKFGLFQVSTLPPKEARSPVEFSLLSPGWTSCVPLGGRFTCSSYRWWT